MICRLKRRIKDDSCVFKLSNWGDVIIQIGERKGCKEIENSVEPYQG